MGARGGSRLYPPWTPMQTIFPTFRGLRTSPDGTSLPDGYFSEAKNVRFDTGVIRLRAGTTSLAASGLSSVSCVGSGMFSDGTNVWCFFAIDDTSTVKVYYHLYNGSSWSGSPVEATVSSGGKFGGSRLTTGYPVTFTGVPGRYGTRYVLVQNGNDTPRVIDLASVSSGLPVLSAIDAPTQAASHNPVYSAAGFLDLTQSVTTSASDANFAWTLSTNRWLLTTAGTISAGATAVIYNTSTGYVDLSGSEQVWVVVSNPVDSAVRPYVWLQKLKWEVRTSAGNYYTVHDPANGLDNAVVVSAKDSAIIGFPVSNHVKAGNSLSSVDGVRVTAAVGLVAADFASGAVQGILASGNVPGGAQYAVSWENSSAKYEGPSVVMPNPSRGVNKTAIWGTTSVSLDDEWELPIDPSLYYETSLPTFAPSGTARSAGVDKIAVYRQDPGDAFFYFVESVTAATYSGSWSWTSPYTAAGDRQFYTDTAPTWSKDDTRVSPGAYVEPPPKGLPCAYSGGRLMVGCRGDGNKIKVSDRDYPFRFRSVPIGDGEELGFQSVLEDPVVAIVPGSASLVGGGFVYAFTERGLYQLSDVYIQKIASVGTLDSHSVTLEDNTLYLIDRDLQVRRVQGGIDHLSRFTVDGEFTSGASMVRWRGRLYVRTADDTVMVYSDLIGDWESKDDNNQTVKYLHRWDFYGESKLMMIDALGSLYQYESGTTDAGTGIDFALTSREYHTPGFEQIRAVSQKVLCDSKSGVTLTTTYTEKYSGATATGSIDIAEATAGTWKVDNSSGKDVGVRGAAIKFRLSGTMTPTFRLYGWQADGLSVGGRGAKS